MKIVLTLMIITFLTITVSAQVSGEVIDASTGEKLIYATVLVTDSIQDKVVAFAYTDSKGEFELKIPKNPNGKILSVQYLGYATYTRVMFTTVSENLKIALQPSASELTEITLTKKQKAVEVKGDKVIFNIEQLGIGSGNNGLETMQQIPGISLDKDENLQFHGSIGVQIMINGRKSLLQGDDLREYIRTLQGDDIQYVEIIAQPSARYEATGTTGILNIVLRKNRKESLTGSVYVRAYYGEYFKQRYGAKLYYKDSLWNLNAGGNYYTGNSVNHRRIIQTIELGDDKRVIDQSNQWLPHTESKSFYLGVERRLSKNQFVSTQWNYNNSVTNADTYGSTTELNNNVLSDKVKLLQKESEPVRQIFGNVYYKYTSDSATTKLEAQLNYAKHKHSIDDFVKNEYADGSDMQLTGENAIQYKVVNGQIDLNQHLSDKWRLEVGAKYSSVDMDYFNAFQTNRPERLLVPDSALVNDFDYTEKLTSAYTQLSFDLEQWSFLVGLRVENTKYNALSKINDQENDGDYTNWFPSFSVNHTNGNNQYKLSYSRRIGRPNYLQISPYYNYLDAYTLEKGNPNIKPQFYHSFALDYVYKNAMSIGLYGYLYNKGFTDVIDYIESENYNIYYQANAATGNRFGLSASLPYQPFDWWVMQAELGLNHYNEKSDIPNYAYDVSGFGYNVSLYQRFVLPKKLTVTWNGFYSKRKSSNGYNRPNYDFSISVKKMFWEDKVQFVAGCSNILKKSMYSRVSRVENVTVDWTNKWETRRFNLQLTYYFGRKKSEDVKGTSLGEEKKRM